MKEVFEKAGINVTEAAALLEITRGTLYAWIAGRPPKNKKMFTDALKRTEVLRNAVEERKLPLHGVPKNERLSILKKLLAESD